MPTIYLYFSYENYKRISDAAEARKMPIKDFVKYATLLLCREAPK